ncbi:MAG: hypothetical protein Q4D98_07185 [Planctomycetia bacterium]|nr:hypothetical protein [Planctomycetia bacterium]
MKNIEIQIDETPRKTGFNTWTLATAVTGNETYAIQMVRFDEPSKFGIREGRISKLYIADASGKTALNYDRGWDLRPQTTATKALLRAILDKFN